MIHTVEIFFNDLNPVAKTNLLDTFETREEDENWDTIPISILERENGNNTNEEHSNIHPRVENWRKFSQYMEQYIEEKTVSKYGMSNSNGFDLMSMTQPIICVWNIIRYSLRIWNNRMKMHDLEKIAHYSELAWTISKGNLIRNESGDKEKVLHV